MTISKSEFAQPWLKQFKDEDREVAGRLADAVMLVGKDAFGRNLRELLDKISAGRNEADMDRPIALYAERAVEKERIKNEEFGYFADKILPIFPGTATGRALGPGVPPVTVNPKDQQVGSEGLIANFITSYERLHGNRVLNHPGPDALRKARPSHIVVVTDFIGSGTRVWNMLEAFYEVATIKSWHSFKKIRLAVVAFSGTPAGLSRVQSHRTKPIMGVAHSCPVIWTAFDGKDMRAVQKLCEDYPGNLKYPFGFDGGAALIAFSHGMPNNSPSLLHSTVRGWKPLFHNRSALDADMHFPDSDADVLAEQAKEKLKIRAAKAFLDDPAKRRWIETMLVLTALENGARDAATASARTHLPLAEVEEILVFTQIAHWTTAGCSITPLGRRELNRLKVRRTKIVELPSEGQPYYYPTQLRAR